MLSPPSLRVHLTSFRSNSLHNGAMNVREAVFTRRAMRSFDPTATISRDELLLLLHEAALAPSALNLQPWEFIVCTEPTDKKRLRDVAFDQQKLLDASAVVVILGKLALHERVADHPEANCFPPGEEAEWSRLANWAYAENPSRQRDEAFRSCSLYAMTFMLIAQALGWVTAPVGGFDENALSAAFAVPPTHIPVLLIAVGKPGQKQPKSPRGARVRVEELVHWGRFGGKG